MQDEIVQFKGRKDGLELILSGSKEYADLKDRLCSILDRSKSFFNKGDVAVKISGKRLLDEEKTDLEAILSKQFSLGKITFEDPPAPALPKEQSSLAASLARAHTLPPLRSNPGKSNAQSASGANAHTKGDVRPIAKERSSGDSVFIRGTIRSGQRITANENITVIGDVNPGAELVAGKNITVMGTLRGLAHAGAYGDETAVVVALNLLPVQLRIAGKIAISPDGGEEIGYPEVAVVKDGEIIIEPAL